MKISQSVARPGLFERVACPPGHRHAMPPTVPILVHIPHPHLPAVDGSVVQHCRHVVSSQREELAALAPQGQPHGASLVGEGGGWAGGFAQENFVHEGEKGRRCVNPRSSSTCLPCSRQPGKRVAHREGMHMCCASQQAYPHLQAPAVRARPRLRTGPDARFALAHQLHNMGAGHSRTLAILWPAGSSCRAVPGHEHRVLTAVELPSRTRHTARPHTC